ncbi:hypothetical protein BROSI_A3473 [Candidatus Brocadia sinica JPN1]|uniref:DUF1722 domain-containing protein n=2 Tax=Candidatus Brocadia TaxID=380240 RepID=A0ABQ0K1K6_9BACT|nr:DUF1722 domain-containing protein [Candidatus Brocadia sp. AMX1]NOG42713.1 DUF1722 domain-containing protein [Planctomycetota bacterium]GAN34929.1 hypothetical protein BROSI_A3473 [Candidatus Brocadia sinica JPN1]GIK11943.1 MAG: hypothetical protein BroJett002_06500 [Candidatus Brocadia sinica]GJQ18011.1 MAG: hypothetical protein HBSIN01_19700 [Candidatus Brocadia sinica]
MHEKIKMGISSCLLGEKVRYDGRHKLDRFITDTLGQYFEWVPVCPECEYGLPVPREPLRLVGRPESPRLITIKTGIDHTEKMLQWAEKKLGELEQENLCGFIFKSKSPSSGIVGVKMYTPSGIPSQRGAGIFGGAFMKHFPLIPVIDDGRLHNPQLRENFIENVFVFQRWQKIQKSKSINDLVEFHTNHKLLMLAHSPRHYSSLGQLVASAKRVKQEDLFSAYIQGFTEGMRLLATPKKNANVLLHISGYFKKLISADEKQELLEIIENYRMSFIPLIVPITLIKHYVRKYNIAYLQRQHYLNPHPMELMLRNHV